MEILIKEIKHEKDKSIIHEEVKKRGSYAGAIMFFVCAVSDIAERRGYRYVVLLKSEDREICDRCEWSADHIVGFMNDKNKNIKNIFPDLYEEGKEYTIEDIKENEIACKNVKNICSW